MWAILDKDVAIRVNGVAATVKESEIRYPRLPASATTRVNGVLGQRAPDVKGVLEIRVCYRSMSGAIHESAIVTVAARPSRAWTAGPDGTAWTVLNIAYVGAVTQ
jgi:hypothetical protein